MRFRSRSFLSLFLIAVAAYAVLSARHWSFKAALFPITIGIPLIVLAMAQLILELFGKAETDRGPAVELEFSADVALEVARRRVTTTFVWIVGFILLVLFFGFPVAVPLFILSYLRLQSRAGWWQSIGLTAAAWGFFYTIFQRLIHLQFEAGLVQSWLGL
ncbi:MAG: tripartite tricarboxylate transporter TctB family protein [Candidatus Binatia bacterium]